MRPLLSLLLLIGLFAGAVVNAQEADPAEFFPYAPGNEWEYIQIDLDFSTTPATETVTGYTRVEVLRDTVVNGLPGSVYTVARLDASQEPASEVTCTGYRDDNALRWYVSPRDCVLGEDALGQDPLEGFYYLYEVSPGGSIEVGGEAYAVSGLSDFGIPCGPFPQTFCDFRWKHAGGVGLYYWHVDVSSHGSRDRDEGRLTYARVGGEVFGAPVVANEPVPDHALGSLTVAVFPNPSRGRVRVSVAGAVTGPVELALYDMLGRRVWTDRSGPVGGVGLEMGSFPRGVYVLRVRDRAGAEAATRVTRLD